MTTPVIVVPLDGSEHALVALPVAKRLAELTDATVHLLHVARETLPPAEVLERIGLTATQLRGSVLGTKAGEPGSAIVQAGRELEAVLIVMCTHSGGDTDKTLGSTALAVLTDAPCPLVLVRPERGVIPWALHQALLLHDGTPTISAAIRPAAELARRAGAEFIVLHVAAPGARLSSEQGSLMAPRYMDQPQHEWPAWGAEFIERLGCMCPLDALNVRMFLAQGALDDEVRRAAAAHSSDLIVLAWRGEWGGKHGAVVKTVIHGAPCPVMILRTKQ